MKNNKLFLALMIFLFGSQLLMAQKFTPITYKKGDLSFNAGVGFLPTASSANVNAKIPPLSLSANYRVSKNASVGAFAAFASTSFRSDLPKHAVIPRSSDSQQFMVGARGSVHYDLNKTTFYGGLMLGYNQERMVTDIPESMEDEIPVFPVVTKGKAIYTAFIGTQHMLTKSLGLYGEVGYGISIFNLGLSFKL